MVEVVKDDLVWKGREWEARRRLLLLEVFAGQSEKDFHRAVGPST